MDGYFIPPDECADDDLMERLREMSDTEYEAWKDAQGKAELSRITDVWVRYTGNMDIETFFLWREHMTVEQAVDDYLVHNADFLENTLGVDSLNEAARIDLIAYAEAKR